MKVIQTIKHLSSKFVFLSNTYSFVTVTLCKFLSLNIINEVAFFLIKLYSEI